MKIGILTYHSQMNYGGVLQAWALQEHLKSEGHDVSIIDRWIEPGNFLLKGPFAGWQPKCWAKLFIAWLKGYAVLPYIVRHIKTMRYVRKNLVVSAFHFHQWRELDCKAIELLNNYDLIVVGSDQVWHGGDWGDPRPYLLQGAPRIPAISYAASFGMDSIPVDMRDDYIKGLQKFRALSVRESSGCEILAELGMTSEHVLDPTLLLNPAVWRKCYPSLVNKTKRLVCYFVGIGLTDVLLAIEEYCVHEGCNAFILVDSLTCVKTRNEHVKIFSSAAPDDFVRAFSQADCCLTDSFHALMFSSIFDVNVRFIRPTRATRLKMLSRIEEFVKANILGRVVYNSAEEALASMRKYRVKYNKERLEDLRMKSSLWLSDAIKRFGGIK